MQVWYPDWRTESADVLHNMLLDNISVDDAMAEIVEIANTKKAESE